MHTSIFNVALLALPVPFTSTDLEGNEGREASFWMFWGEEDRAGLKEARLLSNWPWGTNTFWAYVEARSKRTAKLHNARRSSPIKRKECTLFRSPWLLWGCVLLYRVFFLHPSGHMWPYVRIFCSVFTKFCVNRKIFGFLEPEAGIG